MNAINLLILGNPSLLCFICVLTRKIEQNQLKVKKAEKCENQS